MAFNPKDPIKFNVNDAYTPSTTFAFDSVLEPPRIVWINSNDPVVFYDRIIDVATEFNVITSADPLVISHQYLDNEAFNPFQVVDPSLSYDILLEPVIFSMWSFPLPEVKAIFDLPLIAFPPFTLPEPVVYLSNLSIDVGVTPLWTAPDVSVQASNTVDVDSIKVFTATTPIVQYPQFIQNSGITIDMPSQLVNKISGYSITAPDNTDPLVSSVIELRFSAISPPESWNIQVNSTVVFSGIAGTVTSAIVPITLDGTDVTITLTGVDSNGEELGITESYTTVDENLIPAITTPAAASTLGNNFQNFTITDNGSGATLTRFTVGDDFQQGTYYDSDAEGQGIAFGTDHTILVENLPIDSEAVFATVFFTLEGNDLSANYAYTAVDFPAGLVDNFVGTFADPDNDIPSTLKFDGSSHTLEWLPYGDTVTGWQVIVTANQDYILPDSTAVLEGDIILDTGGLQSHERQYTLTDLPVRGESFTVTFTSFQPSGNVTRDYQISAYNSRVFLIPDEGTVSDGTFKFTWGKDKHPVQSYDFVIRQDGVIIYENYEVDSESTGQLVTNIPTTGVPIRATLTYNALAYSGDITVQLSTLGAPELLTPLGDLPKFSTPVVWSPRGFDIDGWRVIAGSSFLGREMLDTGFLSGDVVSSSLGSLPQDGSIVYFTLYYREVGTTEYKPVHYNFVAFYSPPEITFPNLNLPDLNYDFTNLRTEWEEGSVPVSSWRLTLGSGEELNDYYDSNVQPSNFLSYTHPIVPENTETVYWTLYYLLSGREGYQKIKYSVPVQVQPELFFDVTGTDTSEITVNWIENEVNVLSWGLTLKYADDGSTIASRLNLAANVNQLSFSLPVTGRSIEAYLDYDDGISVRTVVDKVTENEPKEPKILTPDVGLPALADFQSIDSASVLVSWSAGTEGSLIEGWEILVGSTEGGAEYRTYSGIPAISRAVSVKGYPLDGSPIYITLKWTYL